MNFRACFYVLFVLLAGLTACQKEDTPLPQPLTTRLNTFNLTGTDINIFQNGNRINNINFLYAGGATGYRTVSAGTQRYQVKRAGAAPVLFDVPLTLDSLTQYSLFIASLTADDIILVEDTFEADTGDVALVRFVNASPDGTANLDVRLNDTLAIGNAAYKSVSGYTPFTTGEKQLKVLRAGSAQALVTDTVLLQPGSAYTIYAKGLPGQGGNAGFGAGIISN